MAQHDPPSSAWQHKRGPVHGQDKAHLDSEHRPAPKPNATGGGNASNVSIETPARGNHGRLPASTMDTVQRSLDWSTHVPMHLYQDRNAAPASDKGDDAGRVPSFDDGPSNGHLGQVYARGSTYESRTDIPFDLFLQPNARRMRYRRRKGEAKTVIHWGQRKLFISELSFLTQYAEAGMTVVYAGAAPGTHTTFLIELFAQLRFVLIDPAPFSKKLVQSDRVILRQELFTDETAREFTDGRVLFICDIRSMDTEANNEEEKAAQIREDMDAQMRWHEIMKPVKSMMKFRLPWTPGSTEYLAGDVELPVWGPITTTETRLIPSQGRCQWDHQKYEEQMFYFNTVTRVARYRHHCDVHPDVGDGLDYCFDCKAEVEILSSFLCKHRGYNNSDGAREDLMREVARMSRDLSHRCDPTRTLRTGNVDPQFRKTVIVGRQWINGQPAYDVAKNKEGGRGRHRGQSQTAPKKVPNRKGFKKGCD